MSDEYTKIDVAIGQTVDINAVRTSSREFNLPAAVPGKCAIGVEVENIFIGTGEALNKALESNKYHAVFDTATGTFTGLKKGRHHLKSRIKW